MWLGHWSSAKDATDHSWRYLEVYVTLGISYSLCTLLRQVCVVYEIRFFFEKEIDLKLIFKVNFKIVFILHLSYNY